GGLGSERIVEVIAPAEITVSAVFERMRVRPWGIFGGGPASTSAILIRRKGDEQFRTFQDVFGTISPAKFANCVVRGGDQILLRSPGGGGYGPPEEREPDEILRDVEQGFVSPAAARTMYRVALSPSDEAGFYFIDRDATEQLRGGRRAR